MSPGVCPGGLAVSFLSSGQGLLENDYALAEYGTYRGSSLHVSSGDRSGCIRALFEESWHSGKMNLFQGRGGTGKEGRCLLSLSLSHLQETTDPWLTLEVLSGSLDIVGTVPLLARYMVMRSGPVFLLCPTCPVIAFCL